MSKVQKSLQLFSRNLFLLKRKPRLTDDYVWEQYHRTYEQIFEQTAKEYTRNLKDVPFEVVDGHVIIPPPHLPLHENHRLIYELCLNLNPTSILEIGAEGGHHLISLKALMGKIELNEHVELYGVDISSDQIEWAKRMFLELADHLWVDDFTVSSLSAKYHNMVDVAFTQAVVMNIQKGDRHKTFIKNMTIAARKQIVLMGNWSRHQFVRDIKSLRDGGFIPWKEVYLYKQDSGKQICMVVSSVKLDLELLHNDDELRKYP